MVENQFISSLLLHGEVEQFDFEAGFSPELLGDATSQRAFKFIENHLIKYSKYPSKKTFENEFQNYSLRKVAEPPQYYAKKVYEKWLTNAIGRSFKNAEADILGEKPIEAFERLQKEVGKMSMFSLETTDGDATENVKSRYNDYEELEKRDGILGYTYPWETLNDISGGIEKGQMVVLGGQRKTGKTWSAVKIAHHFHSVLKLKVLFISPEMRRTEIMRRYDSIDAGLDYNAFRRGKLDSKSKKKFKKSLQNTGKKDSSFYVADTSDSESQLTIKYVEGKMIRYKPDVVIIDAIYLIMDEQKTANITTRMYNLTRYVKTMAKRTRLPVIAVTQMKRGKDTDGDIDDIGWSDSFAQDCDMMFKVQPKVDTTKAEITVLANREGVAGGKFSISWDFTKTSFHELDEDLDYDTGDDEYDEEEKNLYEM